MSETTTAIQLFGQHEKLGGGGRQVCRSLLALVRTSQPCVLGWPLRVCRRSPGSVLCPLVNHTCSSSITDSNTHSWTKTCNTTSSTEQGKVLLLTSLGKEGPTVKAILGEPDSLPSKSTVTSVILSGVARPSVLVWWLFFFCICFLFIW